jgi:hypothetical protein
MIEVTQTSIHMIVVCENVHRRCRSMISVKHNISASTERENALLSRIFSVHWV